MLELEALLTEAEGIVFDCDGTLLDNVELYRQAWAEGFASTGIDLDRHWHAQRSGLSENVLIDAFEREYGVTVDRQAVVRRMRQTYLEGLDQLRELTPVTAIARRFYGRKPLAVASGGSRQIVLASLRRLGLHDLFAGVVTFDDVGVAKPRPELFLQAARCLSLPAPRCLVFEDSPQGIEAGRRAGMTVVDVAHVLSVALPVATGLAGHPC